MKQQVKFFILFLLLTLNFSKISAQLCNGSLGDPVVNITFGSGSNPGPPLIGSTNYNYVTKDCPDDGSYTIENATNDCFGHTWFGVTEDHTPGDVNGYMMVVNASFNPGDFFVKTVDGLCPNTTYEFAAWILNILRQTACGGNGIKPNITFSIETTSGTVLKSYQTGDIPATFSAEWKQYGFFFSTTTGTSSVVLRMTNNAPGGCGNDLLLDDITFRACGPLVTANIIGLKDSIDICEGDNSNFTLQANVSSGYNDPVYQWQLSTNNGASWKDIPGATNTTYVRPPAASAGTYLYRFAVSERSNLNISSCSILSNIVSITVNKLPVVAASSRGNCTGDTLFLNAGNGALFSWTGPMNFASTEQNPIILNTTVGNSGMYYVKVTSAKGCVSIDSTSASLNIKPVVNAGSDAEICEGTNIQLSSTGNNITSYQWMPANGLSDVNIPNPVASPLQTTEYILNAFDNSCRSSDSVLVTVDQNPRADAGPDKVILQGQTVMLNGTAGGSNIFYTWTPVDYMSASSTLTPAVNPPFNQTYTLTVTSNAGCGTATDDVLVKVYKGLFIPNAFTPNGDGLNDTWNIETLQAYPNAEVKVFNRYGQVVFDNHGIYSAWDGKYKGVFLSSGAYPYTIDLKNKTPLIKGVVFIIK